MPEQAANSYNELAKSQSDAEKGLHEFARTTRDNINKTYDAGKQSIDQIHTQSIQGADAAKTGAIAQIDAACSSTVAAIGAQGAAQIAAIHSQARGARTGITQAGAAAMASVAHACDQASSGIELPVTRAYARTSAEAHLYMDLRPCACGDIEFARHSAVTNDGGVLCSRYDGACRSCGAQRSFLFELPEVIRPIREGTVDFGGDDPSRLLDPGEWLAVADYFAKLDPGTPDDLDIAAAAVAEVLKFIPRDAERVPDEAFRTDRGRAVRDLEPGRFRRSRLEAVRDAYRELLARHRAPAPASALRLDDQPVAALIDALATALARQHGFTGDELRHRVSDLTGQLTSVARRFEIAAREDLARKQTAAEVERILDGIVQTGTSAGAAIAAHRDAISKALRGVDLAQLTARLQAIVDWMRDPSQARSPDDLIASLEASVGAMVAFPDPLTQPGAPAETRPTARETSEASRSLDQLFSGARKDSR